MKNKKDHSGDDEDSAESGSSASSSHGLPPGRILFDNPLRGVKIGGVPPILRKETYYQNAIYNKISEFNNEIPPDSYSSSGFPPNTVTDVKHYSIGGVNN